MMTHLLLWGNAYAQIIRNGKGEVMAIYPLMPNRMTVDRNERGELYYKYQLIRDDAQTMKGSCIGFLSPESSPKLKSISSVTVMLNDSVIPTESSSKV